MASDEYPPVSHAGSVHPHTFPAKTLAFDFRPPGEHVFSAISLLQPIPVHGQSLPVVASTVSERVDRWSDKQESILLSCFHPGNQSKFFGTAEERSDKLPVIQEIIGRVHRETLVNKTESAVRSKLANAVRKYGRALYFHSRGQNSKALAILPRFHEYRKAFGDAVQETSPHSTALSDDDDGSSASVDSDNEGSQLSPSPSKHTPSSRNPSEHMDGTERSSAFAGSDYETESSTSVPSVIPRNPASRASSTSPSLLPPDPAAPNSSEHHQLSAAVSYETTAPADVGPGPLIQDNILSGTEPDPPIPADFGTAWTMEPTSALPIPGDRKRPWQDEYVYGQLNAVVNIQKALIDYQSKRLNASMRCYENREY